jgi:hypothetical protein
MTPERKELERERPRPRCCFNQMSLFVRRIFLSGCTLPIIPERFRSLSILKMRPIDRESRIMVSEWACWDHAPDVEEGSTPTLF